MPMKIVMDDNDYDNDSFCSDGDASSHLSSSNDGDDESDKLDEK